MGVYFLGATFKVLRNLDRSAGSNKTRRCSFMKGIFRCDTQERMVETETER